MGVSRKLCPENGIIRHSLTCFDILGSIIQKQKPRQKEKFLDDKYIVTPVRLERTANG